MVPMPPGTILESSTGSAMARSDLSLKNPTGTPAKSFPFLGKRKTRGSDQMEHYTSASMRENIKNMSVTLLALHIHLANATGVLPDLPHGFMTQSGGARFG